MQGSSNGLIRKIRGIGAALYLLLLCASIACSQSCPAAFTLQTALCEHKLGLSDYAAGNLDHAETHYLRALKVWEQTGDRYPAEQVVTLIGLGRLYQATHRPREAAQALTRGLDLARPLEAARPQLIAVTLSRLGGLYSMSGQLQQARSVLSEGIARLRSLQKPDLPELAYAWNALGMVELRSGHWASGESNLRQAVAVATECLGGNDHQTAIYEMNLGLALYLEGQFSRALPLLRRAEFLLESGQSDDNAQLGSALVELSAVETAQGKLALAEDDAARALSVLRRHFPLDSGEVVQAQVNLAAIYLVEHKTTKAAEILPETIAAERRMLTGGRALAGGIRWLAQLRAQQGRWPEAGSLYREALEMYEAEPGPAPSEIGAVRREYAKVVKQERAKSPAASPAT